jgi:hypothetical protein
MLVHLYALLYRRHSVLRKSKVEGVLRRWPRLIAKTMTALVQASDSCWLVQGRVALVLQNGDA